MFLLMRLLGSLSVLVFCVPFIVIEASSVVHHECYFEQCIFRHALFVSTVALKDRCKMFCRVSTSSAYYMLTDRVVDGTKCGPFTSDICLQGKCHVSALPPAPPSSSRSPIILLFLIPINRKEPPGNFLMYCA